MATALQKSEKKGFFGSLFKKSPKAPKAVPPRILPPIDVFEGTGGEETRRFVNHVYQSAFKRGMESDDIWKAKFAASCFRGGALEWFETLDDNTKWNWTLLRDALKRDFPMPREDNVTMLTPPSPPPRTLSGLLSSSPTSSTFAPAHIRSRSSTASLSPQRFTIPTPAAFASARPFSEEPQDSDPSTSSIPAAAPPPPKLMGFLSQDPGPHNGQLRVSSDDGAISQYVYYKSNSRGGFSTCAKFTSAMAVTFDPLAAPGRLACKNSATADEWLGLGWRSKPEAETPGYLVGLKGLEPNLTLSSVPTSKDEIKGPFASTIWDIFQDGSISVFYQDPDTSTTRELTLVLAPTEFDWYKIYLVLDFDKFVESELETSTQKGPFRKAWFVFEPL